jgi:hypothetical protein
MFGLLRTGGRAYLADLGGWGDSSMYWLAILIGAVLGLGGGGVALLSAYSTHGLTPLFGPPSFSAYGIYVLTMLGPIVSILAAVFAFKKQYLNFAGMWVPEIAGMMMYVSSLLIVGFIATNRISLLPAAACALGGLFILVASDELKRAPASA